MAITRFGLLRHGLTVWNEEKRIQGSKDSPLTDTGKTNLLTMARSLRTDNWSRILASDLGRSRQSVEIINSVLHIPVHYDARLREIDWGDWEGLRLSEVRQYQGEELERQVLSGWDFQAPGGERRRDALLRAKAALTEVPRRNPEEEILVICHLGIIKCLIFDAMKLEFLPGEVPRIEKDRLHILSLSAGELQVQEINHCGGNWK